jgi:hypothetical protein
MNRCDPGLRSRRESKVWGWSIESDEAIYTEDASVYQEPAVQELVRDV